MGGDKRDYQEMVDMVANRSLVGDLFFKIRLIFLFNAFFSCMIELLYSLW